MPREKGAGSAAWRDPSGVEDAEPAARLLAAMIHQAVIDARVGDLDARLWLIEDAPCWLPYLLPDTYDPDEMHETLLRAAGCRESVPSA